MRKHVEESVATGVAAGRGRGGRFSAGRKREVVMRLLRGEDLKSVSRAVGITAARASHWRAQFLAAGHSARLKGIERQLQETGLVYEVNPAFIQGLEITV